VTKKRKAPSGKTTVEKKLDIINEGDEEIPEQKAKPKKMTGKKKKIEVEIPEQCDDDIDKIVTETIQQKEEITTGTSLSKAKA